MARPRTWKGLSILVALALMLALGAVAVPLAGTLGASPGTHYYVNATTGDDLFNDGSAGKPWKTITHAVANVPAGASPADPNVIHVAAGLYDNTHNAEGFSINFNNANVALSGTGAATTIINGEGHATVFQVNADSITIDGFTITNDGDSDGIYVNSVENAIISHNTIIYNDVGVYLVNSNYCEISHNTITDNDLDGIHLDNSNHNTIADNTVCRNQQSCPFVYSWDGEGYRLDSFVFTWSYRQALESTDYDNLEYLTPADGKYRLKMSEELFEISYANELKLMVVDHPGGTQIIPDPSGKIHTLRTPYAPIAGEDEDGTDCLDKVKDSDGIYWTSNLDNKDFSKEEDLRDGIVLTFDKPQDAQIAKVAVNFKTTKLVDDISNNLLKLEGKNRDEDLCARLNLDPSEVEAMYELLYLLHVEVWNGSEWVSEGTFFPEPGSWIARDDIKTIDVSRIEGNTVKIKLESLTGLVLIDSVRMDYSADEEVITTELSATTAVDANGTDVAPEILANDDQYLVLEQGDYAYLSFDELAANPAYDRSYIIKARGYYQGLTAAEGEVQDELLEKLLTDYPYAARYFLGVYYSPHSGIDLVNSSNNTISGNDICDNLGDGIYLGSAHREAITIDNDHSNTDQFTDNGGSDSNQIVENDIHGNWHGIFIDASDDNTIRYNNITENVWEDSGIHVAADSSGNVANCNNIEDNGPYGAWNDPANPRLDATKNWWGYGGGPSGAGLGSGDAVSENVDYDPWLSDEFQYCLDCGGIPRSRPAPVPTVNHWGIVAMISLFAGLLVWTVRKRRTISLKG